MIKLVRSAVDDSTIGIAATHAIARIYRRRTDEYNMSNFQVFHDDIIVTAILFKRTYLYKSTHDDELKRDLLCSIH